VSEQFPSTQDFENSSERKEKTDSRFTTRDEQHTKHIKFKL